LKDNKPSIWVFSSYRFQAATKIASSTIFRLIKLKKCVTKKKRRMKIVFKKRIKKKKKCDKLQFYFVQGTHTHTDIHIFLFVLFMCLFSLEKGKEKREISFSKEK